MMMNGYAIQLFKSKNDNTMTIAKQALKPYIYDVNLNAEKYDVTVSR